MRFQSVMDNHHVDLAICRGVISVVSMAVNKALFRTFGRVLRDDLSNDISWSLDIVFLDAMWDPQWDDLDDPALRDFLREIENVGQTLKEEPMKFYVNGQEREASRKEWPRNWGEETGQLYEIQGDALSPGDDVTWSGELPPPYTLWVMIHVQLREGEPATTGHLRLTRSDLLR